MYMILAFLIGVIVGIAIMKSIDVIAAHIMLAKFDKLSKEMYERDFEKAKEARFDRLTDSDIYMHIPRID